MKIFGDLDEKDYVYYTCGFVTKHEIIALMFNCYNKLLGFDVDTFLIKNKYKSKIKILEPSDFENQKVFNIVKSKTYKELIDMYTEGLNLRDRSIKLMNLTKYL